MIDNAKLIRSSLWLTASQISNTFISFLISIIIIKSLNVDQYADYGIIISYSMGLTMFSFLGIPNIIQRYLPEKMIGKSYEEIISILISGFYLRAIAILVLLLVTVLVVLIFHIQTIKNIWILSIVVLLYVGGKSFFVIVEEGLNALKKQKVLFNIKTFASAAKLLTIITILFFSGLNIYILLLVLGLYDLIGAVIAILFLIKTFRVKFSLRISSFYKFNKTHIQFGFYNYLSQLQHFILSHSFEIIIISLILSKNIVAEYTFSITIATILSGLFPISAVVKALYPLSIEKYYETNSKTGLNDFLGEFTSFIAVIYSVLTVFVIMNIDWIIKILGKEEYLNTSSVIIVLFLLSLFSILATPLKIGLIILEDAKSLFKSNLSFIPVLFLMPLSAYYFGINGILMIAFFSLLSIILMRAYYLRKRLRENLIKKHNVKILAILLTFTLTAITLNYVIDEMLLKLVLSLLFAGLVILLYKSMDLVPEMLMEFLSFFKVKVPE